MIGKRILVVASHPDDDILGCGGTINKYRLSKNAEVRVVFIAEGTSGRYNKEDIHQKNVMDEIEIRKSSAINALKVLQIDDYEFYSNPCCRLDSLSVIDIGKIVENEIKLFKPDTIISHSPTDVNVDHKITYQAVLQATRPGGTDIVKSFLSYEILSSTEWNFVEGFKPNVFVDISNFIDNKISSMNFYLSELKEYPHPRSIRGIRTLASFRGMQIGVEYAESFSLVRCLVE